MTKIVDKGTCSYCGEEMDMELLDKDSRCPDCKEDDTDDDEPEICGYCNGSGEGMYDGTRCHYCQGSGTTDHGAEEQEDRRDYERDRRSPLKISVYNHDQHSTMVNVAKQIILN